MTHKHYFEITYLGFRLTGYVQGDLDKRNSKDPEKQLSWIVEAAGIDHIDCDEALFEAWQIEGAEGVICQLEAFHYWPMMEAAIGGILAQQEAAKYPEA